MVLWIAILFLLLCLLLQKIQLEIQYWREGKQDRLTLVIRGPFGVALYRRSVSLSELLLTQKEPDMPWNHQADKLQGAKGKGASFSIKDISKIKGLLEKMISQRQRYGSLVTQLLLGIRIEKLVWKTEFGTTDAAWTGICYGFSWIIQGWLLAMLQNGRRPFFSREQIEFTPVFNHPHFATSLHCILSIRIAHVITAQLKWIQLKLRQRKR